MRFFPHLLSLCASTLASTPSEKATPYTDKTSIYIQPISLLPSPPTLLTTISFNPSTLTSTLSEYNAPELPPKTSLLRIGIYDPFTSTWKSSTSTTSAENFSKGYSPTITLTMGVNGDVLGASVKSARVDAGETRDFGPKSRVVKGKRGKGPELNKPVVLSAEGKLEVPEVEKTLLQKYWWVGLVVLMVMVSTGGAE